MVLIDTHAHIYSEEFDADRNEAITKAWSNGVQKILMPAIDSSSHGSMMQLEEVHPGKCIAMMGLHPCYVKDNYEQELSLVEEWLGKRKFVAVGEIGLDFYWDLSFKDQQYIAFHRQVELALKYDLPIVIHSRNSIDECIELIRGHQAGGLRGVFHCFSGNLQQAQQIVGLGFYLGIGGVLSFKNSGLDKVLAEMDLERVVLETDAPYLAPVPYRGKRNEPAYTRLVADKLAAIKGMTVEEVAEITTRNAQELFGL
jgi:TatD DNase family protein